VRWLRRLFGWPEPSAPRTSIPADEFRELLTAERRRLSPEARIPRPGDVYAVRSGVRVDYMTSHFAPFTGGGRARLRRGEKVRVSSKPGPHTVGVTCDPLRYAELEASIVPARERADPTYSRYSLYIKIADLHRRFDLVEEAPEPAGSAS
jgi:hypothetical protein